MGPASPRAFALGKKLFTNGIEAKNPATEATAPSENLKKPLRSMRTSTRQAKRLRDSTRAASGRPATAGRTKSRTRIFGWDAASSHRLGAALAVRSIHGYGHGTSGRFLRYCGTRR